MQFRRLLDHSTATPHQTPRAITEIGQVATTKNRYLAHACVVFLVIVSILMTTVPAQKLPASQQPSQKPTTPSSKDEDVRITTNLVQIDAAVTDKKGKPVTDLSVEDFEIYEDGRQQNITNFSVVSGESGSASDNISASSSASSKAASSPGVAAPPPTVNLRREQIQRTIALVVDDLGLSFESTAYVRNALRKFVVSHLGCRASARDERRSRSRAEGCRHQRVAAGEASLSRRGWRPRRTAGHVGLARIVPSL